MQILFFLKKHLIFLTFIIFLLVVVILPVLLNLNTQKPGASSLLPTPTPFRASPFSTSLKLPDPLIYQEEDAITLPLGTISFTFENQSFPKQKKVYKVERIAFSQTQVETLLKAFAFINEPEVSSGTNGNTLYIWDTGDEQQLQIIPNTGYVSYVNNAIAGKPDIGEKALPIIQTKENAVEVAREYVRTHNISSIVNLPLKQTSVTPFIENHGEPTPTNDFNKANIFNVVFTYELDGGPIYKQYGEIAELSVWIDIFKTVKKLTFQLPTINPSGQNYTILLLDEAKKNILQGKGALVKYGASELGSNSLPIAFTTTVFSQVKIASFYDASSSFIYPIYIFQGEATTASGEKTPITVYLPALKN